MYDAEDWRLGGFGLYIHWPFCQTKCPYCDFNSHVSAKVDQRKWAEAYTREVQRTARLTSGRVLQTIYFGGGTPSLMEPETVDAVISAIRASWPLANNVEITLEANPTSIESARFLAYREAGVNRISMGMQALNDQDLRLLGRSHSVAEGLRAFEIAGNIFDRITFDLIYARQHQTLEQWRAELSTALSLQRGHLSLYQLTIEDGTVFSQRHKLGQLKGLPTDDLGADFYELTQDLCDKAGLPAYEVSNHARRGDESRHNLVYWNSGDYAGVGPGAHGRLTIGGQRLATAAPKPPGAWLSQALADGVQDIDTTLDQNDIASEFLLMGLRLSAGVNLARFGGLTGKVLSPTKIADLIGLDMVELQGDTLRATDSGRPLLNAILRELLVDL